MAVSHWLLSWLSGSLSTLSPCVFPLLPMVLAGVVQGHRWGPLAMGVGMAMTFAGVGVLLGALGPVLGLDAAHLRMLGAVLLMVMGLVIWVPALNQSLTQWMTPLASGAHAMSAHLQGQTLRSAWLLGALLGLVWSPCSGPLLASALILAASEHGAGSGAVVLGFFGLGAATPLVVVAYASRHGFQAMRQGVQDHGEQAKKIMGAAIFWTGLAVASGADKWLAVQVLRLLPESWMQAISLF
jgi:cytochrome c-type biogenesis protein